MTFSEFLGSGSDAFAKVYGAVKADDLVRAANAKPVTPTPAASGGLPKWLLPVAGIVAVGLVVLVIFRR